MKETIWNYNFRPETWSRRSSRREKQFLSVKLCRSNFFGASFEVRLSLFLAKYMHIFSGVLIACLLHYKKILIHNEYKKSWNALGNSYYWWLLFETEIEIVLDYYLEIIVKNCHMSRVYMIICSHYFVSNGMGSQILKTDVVIDVILTTSVVMVRNIWRLIYTKIVLKIHG